ncbi:ABC transporter substrate-binding protein [Methanofollis formosanus]|uniref:ABC transporter substrate-binding protein n=1 Tax=Methanofollis formosanus TaxID=299308 RepID=A0A8G0ZZF7_9EURY|nr:ABC transporter substrate-binding protein [Methanofollis formosanus]QYZ78502.1 ABC transporter substrate-binding protein [Methanofollis formosanus]
MTVYVAMDDTDNLNSRGTGRLARSVAAALAEEYEVFGVTRHQLYVNDAIPYTSHNSCAVLHLPHAEKQDIPAIFEMTEQMMLDDFVEGSDPGLAVASASQVTPALLAFGKDAKSKVLTQEMARSLAKNLDIRLKGLGGTEDGVIGSMAGIGLARAGNDGRFLQVGRIREITGLCTAEELLEAGIDAIITRDGRQVTKGIIEAPEGKSVKPCPIGGWVVLIVDEQDGHIIPVKRD